MASAIRTYNYTNPAIDASLELSSAFLQYMNGIKACLRAIQAIANVPVRWALIHSIRSVRACILPCPIVLDPLMVQKADVMPAGTSQLGEVELWYCSDRSRLVTPHDSCRRADVAFRMRDCPIFNSSQLPPRLHASADQAPLPRLSQAWYSVPGGRSAGQYRPLRPQSFLRITGSWHNACTCQQKVSSAPGRSRHFAPVSFTHLSSS